MSENLYHSYLCTICLRARFESVDELLEHVLSHWELDDFEEASNYFGE